MAFTTDDEIHELRRGRKCERHGGVAVVPSKPHVLLANSECSRVSRASCAELASDENFVSATTGPTRNLPGLTRPEVRSAHRGAGEKDNGPSSNR